MDAPSYSEHVDLLVVLLKWLIGIIGTIGGSLIGVLIWLGTRTIKKVGTMDAKLDVIQNIMMLCEGCSSAAHKYGRRRDDFKADDEGSDV